MLSIQLLLPTANVLLKKWYESLGIWISKHRWWTTSDLPNFLRSSADASLAGQNLRPMKGTRCYWLIFGLVQ